MSLLLEALKKAELAKQSQREATSESETTLPLDSGVDLPTGDVDPNAALDITTGGRGDVMTRDRLPPVDQPLEIVADEPTPAAARTQPNVQSPSGAPARGSIDLRLDETLPPPRPIGQGTAIPPLAGAGVATAAAAAAAARARGDQREITQPNKPWIAAPAEDRQAARQVFEAKQVDYNPRRPFYLTLGALGLFGLGAFGYLMYQIQTPSATFVQRPPAAGAPPTSVATAPAPIQPAPTSAPAPIAPPPSAATPAVAAAPSDATASSAPSSPAGSTTAGAPPLIAIPDLKAPATKPPAAAVKPAPAAVPASTPSIMAGAPTVPPAPQPRALEPARTPSVALASPRPAPAAAPSAAAQPASIQIQRPAPRLDPGVERGYAAFQSGDLEAARQAYGAALRADPFNRDAQLGLAAIDVRTQNYESAEVRYQRLLEADPRDTHALSGLAGLRGGLDPLSTESRLKNLIDQQPESATLHFALGNQLAYQARWTEAQASYFKAFSTDPENPDFAFNLAVSLEQLRQPKLAREYYLRAVDLAKTRQAAFDREQAQTRVRALAAVQ